MSNDERNEPKDGWIKHKMAFMVDTLEDPIPEDFKQFIPVLVEDKRDRLASDRFGEGNWQKGEITYDWKVHTRTESYEDEDGTTRILRMHYMIVRGFVWGPVDENYDYGQSDLRE